MVTYLDRLHYTTSLLCLGASLASQPYFPHARKILRGREERKNTSGNSCQVFVSLPENEVVQSGESSHVIIVYSRDRHVTLRHIQSTCIYKLLFLAW